MQVVESIWNSSNLKERVMESLVDQNSAQDRRAKKKLFEYLLIGSFLMQYGMKSETNIAKDVSAIEINCGKLLESYGRNIAIMFTWWRNAMTGL